MIDIEWVGDIPSGDQEVLMKWLLKRQMDIGDTQGEHIQLPNGRHYDFKVFRASETEYEMEFRAC